MRLTRLLERLEYEVRQGSDETEITELVNDSRKVTEGSVFVCISGAVILCVQVFCIYVCVPTMCVPCAH